MSRNRPREFRFNNSHSLAQGLVFASLGRHTGSLYCHDSSLYKNHFTLKWMDPATDWALDPYLGRRTLAFDGANDYGLITSPTMTIADDFGFAAWLHVSTSQVETVQRFTVVSLVGVMST